MSSPPLDFPSSDLPDADAEGDVEMGDSTLANTSGSNTSNTLINSLGETQGTEGEQSMPEAPPRRREDPLFLQGTPSVRGTPARRAGGTPLFMGGPASSPLAFPSSSPAQPKTPRRFPRGAQPLDSDPLDFPSSPVRPTPRSGAQRQPGSAARVEGDTTPHPPSRRTTTRNGTPIPYVPNRRGDIHSSLSLTPTTRRTRPTTTRVNQGDDDMYGGGANPTSDLPIPPSSSGLAPPRDAHPLSAQAVPTSDEPDEIRAIWGTTVNLQETMKLFRDFLMGFKPKYRLAHDRSLGLPTVPLESPEKAEEVVYVGYLRRMRVTGETNLNLDMRNLQAWPATKKKLYGQLVKYPQEVIPAFDQVLKDAMLDVAEGDIDAGMDGMRDEEGEREIEGILGRVYKVRPWGLESTNMRGLNPNDCDRLVSIRGLVVRTTAIIPDMKVAFFRCSVCLHTLQIAVSRGKISEPNICPRPACASPASMVLIHNRCEYADRQLVKVQETPEEAGSGQTPGNVSVCVYDELCDSVRAGDRVEVVGVWRCVGRRVSGRERRVKALFGTFVDGVWVRVEGGRGGQAGGVGGDKDKGARTERVGLDKSTRNAGDGDGVGVGDGVVENSEEGEKKTVREEKLRELSERGDAYELLARSLAPSIYGLLDVKKGILLQLFGGTNKSFTRGGGGAGTSSASSPSGPRYRGDINILLLGDPGVSKSQILKYVHSIAPRGVYASGKGSSAVGLTAYVTRDPETRSLVLESGALVLSDGGVCCIDEFDKMSEGTRSVLHEVMEQQTVSIAKAGIITTLNARTSILAAANPIGSKYDPDLPVTKNIDLPPTLISRFDLLYLVLDRGDEQEDRRLAKFLCGLYLEDEEGEGERQRNRDREEDGDIVRNGEGEEIIPQNILSAYITHARTSIHPVLTGPAADMLVASYLSLRSMGMDADSTPNAEKRITATTRQLESLIRLSEAHAKMRWREWVEEDDVEEAGRLMREAIRTGAVDPRTGKIDMGLLAADPVSNNALAQAGVSNTAGRGKDDLGRELLNLLDSKGPKGMKFSDAFRSMGEQSSVKIGKEEFDDVVRGLEAQGVVKVGGERERRVIRKIVD